jgi:hypothetical protein
MRRRLAPEDFAEARAAMQGLTDLGTWSACNEYELRGDKIVAVYKLSALEDPLRPEDVWWYYSPLKDAPDLFLTFARLYREKDFERAALAFSHSYGLPNNMVRIVEGKEKIYRFAEEIEISHFWEEAQKAHNVLALYEAVVNQDAQTVRQILLGRNWADGAFEVDEELLSFIEDLEGPNGILRGGKEYIVDVVQDVVRTTCRQVLSVPVARTDFSDIEAVWEFDSLIGAMYLEMWWLLVSGSNIARCEFCGSPISLGRSQPHARKRRRDRRFCNDACRQAHHRAKTNGQNAG